MRAAAVAALFAAAVALTACGEDPMSKEDYRRAAQPIADAYQDERLYLLPQHDTTEWEEFSSALEGMRHQADGTADDFEELVPPEEAEFEHYKLVASLRDIAESATEALDPKVGDEDYREATTKYFRSIEAVEQYGTALDKEVGTDFNRRVTSTP